MESILIKVFLFFLPAGFANMAPVLFKWLPYFNYPLDFRKNFNGKRILGDNKTFRGLFFGILTSIAIVYTESIILLGNENFALINYSSINILLLGFLLGFGAIFGDSVKSFFKRRRDIKSGKSWLLFDQIDWILGAIIFSNLYILLSWKYNLIALILFSLLHPIVNYVGFLIRVKGNRV